MSVSAGQSITAAICNAAFASKTADNTIAGIQTISNTTQSTDKDTGALVIEGGLGIEKNVNIGGNLSVVGNLTVQGSLESIQTTNTEIKDSNIEINKGGTDVSSEGSGITVDRTGTKGSIKYENALVSRFKIGDLGSESEAIVSAFAQILSGDKTFSGNTIIDGLLKLNLSTDSSTAGANATLSSPAKACVRITNASLSSIEMIDSTSSGQVLVLINETGADVDILNETGATATKRILTGTGSDFVFKNQAAVLLHYDSSTQRWHMIGGGGTTFPVQTANTVYSGPSTGSPALPSFRTLVSNDIPNIPASKITSDQVSISQGGTGQSSALSAFNALSPLTTKGDILTRNGTDNIRVAVGNDGEMIMADSTQSSGIKWANSSGPTKKIIQMVNVMEPDVSTTTSTIPIDDTIPQNTEGAEVMTLSITPTSSASKLRIDVTLVMGCDASGVHTVALFKDSDADAIAAVFTGALSANVSHVTNFTHFMDAGTTSAITFKVRGGIDNAGTTVFNGRGTSRQMGGVCASSITITEFGDGINTMYGGATTTQTGSSYTVTTGVGTVLCNPSGSQTINLYTAVGNSGREITIKNISTNSITIDANGSETIDGSATATITTQYASITVVSDGSNWFIK